MSARRLFYLISFVTFAAVAMVAWLWLPALWSLVLFVPLFLLGLYDCLQPRHALRRNFPLLARLRYFAEEIRPEIQQYFIESNTAGRPFSRELRTVVYRRAKNLRDTIPFGTEHDVYRVGYEWMNPSLQAHHPPEEQPRVWIGGKDCKKPYSAAMLNVSAMSYGSLSRQAISALNLGAKQGGFYHNTGEGSISPYHLQGGDLCWQIGTGYFGCRDDDGNFHEERFKKNASRDEVKLIEIKISQGAKPGHGGILPAAKVTPEIAEIRHVPLGKDVLSPPTHAAFTTPKELCLFIAKLRELSGGKPIGFKICLGKRREFFSICKAMLETGVTPDFITVDGGEGGTGAAPLEFTNVLGAPLDETLIFVHNALVGCRLRRHIRIIASGRIMSGFDIAHKIAMGADLCNSARAMMFALGCIQAQKCNSNDCPTGVATQDPQLTVGLVSEDKAERVYHYQHNTVEAFSELIAAAGLGHPDELRPWHIHRRVSPTRVMHYGEMFDYLEPGELLEEPLPESYARAWRSASADSFEAQVTDEGESGFDMKRSVRPEAAQG